MQEILYSPVMTHVIDELAKPCLFFSSTSWNVLVKNAADNTAKNVTDCQPPKVAKLVTWRANHNNIYLNVIH